LNRAVIGRCRLTGHASFIRVCLPMHRGNEPRDGIRGADVDVCLRLTMTLLRVPNGSALM
jgi:hypothetical protein